LLHCHIYIQHVFALFLLIIPIPVPIVQPPSLPYVTYCLLFGVVHLLPSSRDLFVVSAFPCYLKEMRCDWSHRLISNDFSRVKYPHSFAIQLGSWNSSATFLSLYGDSVQFSSIQYAVTFNRDIVCACVCPGIYHNFENATKFQYLLIIVTNQICLKMKLYKLFFYAVVKLGLSALW
jgi:hypothetical protein